MARVSTIPGPDFHHTTSPSAKLSVLLDLKTEAFGLICSLLFSPSVKHCIISDLQTSVWGGILTCPVLRQIEPVLKKIYYVFCLSLIFCQQS